MIRHRRVLDRQRHAEMACAAPDDDKPLTGLRLTALLCAAPFLTLGFAWISYYVVKAIGIVIVIGQALLT